MQDAVPRSGKFLVLFKLGGHRVVINRMGDLVVRPSPLEASLRQIPAGAAFEALSATCLMGRCHCIVPPCHRLLCIPAPALPAVSFVAASTLLQPNQHGIAQGGRQKLLAVAPAPSGLST